nr:hypothetical protein [Actinomycetota bacterium]
MQPGSLIFLLIVAVWAVYLVQHWIRRRDHLATARSVDRFSDAMRVLERRATPVVSATVSPYAASPASAGVVRPALVGRQAARMGREPGSVPVSTGSVRVRPAAVA